MMHTSTPLQRWADGAVVYQIYPRSFKDSNADGIGDLPGVISKLDYLKNLGIDAIWLSPFYPSPMADFGYDIADYRNVDPLFGSLDDAKRLIAEAHERDIRLMVDLVPNHSSDRHAWFIESSASRDNPYADWYIWRDPSGHDGAGKALPPNNWLEVFSGESAWQWNEARQQFYLHSFNVHQPDLNWANPAVREAIKEIMRFWLDTGVDGFRVDAVNFMAKDPDFRDDPDNPEWTEGPWPRYGRLRHDFSQGRPHLYGYLGEMAEVLKEAPYASRQPFMVTEGYPRGNDHIAEYLAYYQGMDPAVAAPFNFEGLKLPWEAGAWQEFLRRFHTDLDAFSPLAVSSYAFSNHDNSRIVSRLGEAKARAAAVLLLTLPGMAFIYNGDELGMADVPVPPEQVVDPDASGGEGRDPERTPLQWTPGPMAGFTDGDSTWLPLAENYDVVNAESEASDQHSFLSLYRDLIALRHASDAIRSGTIEVLDAGNLELLAFIRRSGSEAYLTLISFADTDIVFPLIDKRGELLISSFPDTVLNGQALTSVTLLPKEAAVIRLDNVK